MQDDAANEGPDDGIRSFDTVIAACDLPGIKKVMPASFKKIPMLEKVYNLDTVPIATVQV